MMFSDLTISGSAMYTYRKWMDALSDNIANINTVRPFNQPAFSEEFVQANSANVNGSGGGVKVTAIQHGDSTGILTYDPTNPNAGANGYVRRPDINLTDQMTNLILAQRGYQANAQAISQARTAYQAALSLGK